MKTIELLDAAKVASGCATDYQFAKRHNLTLAAVSRWRNGKATFDDDHAAMIARILGREPGEIAALCQAERAKTEASRSMWLRVAALLAAIVAPPTAGAAVPGSFDYNADTLPIIRKMRRFLSGPAVRMA